MPCKRCLTRWTRIVTGCRSTGFPHKFRAARPLFENFHDRFIFEHNRTVMAISVWSFIYGGVGLVHVRVPLVYLSDVPLLKNVVNFLRNTSRRVWLFSYWRQISGSYVRSSAETVKEELQ